jgi:hypothetical protein
MNAKKYFRSWIIYATCGTLVAPPSIWSAELRTPPAAATAIRMQDVRLDRHQKLSGQLVDAQNRVVAGADVHLCSKDQVLSRSVTDASGCFEFGDLRAGVYQVLAPGTGGIYRVWQARSAPPSARPRILMVQGPVVRGQGMVCEPTNGMPGVGAGLYDGSLMRTLSSPWVFAGLVGAAIAIPIAVANDDDDDREGS